MRTVVGVLAAAAVGIHCSAPAETPEERAPEVAPPESSLAPPARASSATPSGAPALPNLSALAHAGSAPLVTSMVRDESGATFVTGTFVGSVGMGNTVISSRGDKDVFLLKLDPAGAFAWVRGVGSASDERAPRVTLDGQSVTVVGMTKGEMDCGSGPLGTWSSETFFLCVFGGADGNSLMGGVFPTGSP